MMEKSGALAMNVDDIIEYGKGNVSQRIQTDWGLTHKELHGMIKANQIRLVAKQPTNTETEDKP